MNDTPKNAKYEIMSRIKGETSESCWSHYDWCYSELEKNQKLAFARTTSLAMEYKAVSVQPNKEKNER